MLIWCHKAVAWQKALRVLHTGLASAPHQYTTCPLSGSVRARVSLSDFVVRNEGVKKPEGWTFPYFSHWLLHLWMFSSSSDSRWRHNSWRHSGKRRYSTIKIRPTVKYITKASKTFTQILSLDTIFFGGMNKNYGTHTFLHVTLNFSNWGGCSLVWGVFLQFECLLHYSLY